ncbi:hypothetical protein HK097_007061 [Rhizophlyctis rosea]|uniref:Cardiolipin synthase N-terminal domain-containing protein n=1 Tax=Rhizophlyctis rosea TaxID=64517 RepID=A0AAD5SDZ9_9FUNG|nr:hypothetical protein HK097_007061 [Rhizophlyctis rosea]
MAPTTKSTIPASLLPFLTFLLFLGFPAQVEARGYIREISGSLVGLVVLVLDIIAVIEVLGSNRSVTGKLGWTLMIFFFPVVGIIIYFLFGNRSGHGGYESIGA